MVDSVHGVPSIFIIRNDMLVILLNQLLIHMFRTTETTNIGLRSYFDCCRIQTSVH